MKRSYTGFVRRLASSGLLSDVEERTRKMRVSLLDLYEGPDKAQSIAAARRAVYGWLMKEGKSLNEVARLFDRAPNGVWKLTRTRVSK